MSGLHKVPQSSLVRFFLTGPIGQCCKLPPIKTGQRDNLSNAQGYHFDVTLVLWRYDPRHTCALFGLCYTPATQTPPSGWPACEGFYPREGCCWSCSHRMQMTALATSGQADNLCKTGKKIMQNLKWVNVCITGLREALTHTSLSLLRRCRRSQSHRGHGRVSVGSLALLSTTQAP